MTPEGLARLKADEGCDLHAYPDPLTHDAPWTIGYGCTGPNINPETVWTQGEADTALAQRVFQIEDALWTRLPFWVRLDPARRDCLTNMAYNLGVDGLSRFDNTLRSIGRGDYAGAAVGMLSSLWGRQLPQRAERLATIMKTGAYP